MPSVLRTFALSLAFAFIGTMAGVFVPTSLFLPLSILELVMLFAAFFFRRKKAISYSFLYIFTFISGITLYPIVAHYMATTGANTVIMAFATTTVVFTGIAIYASKSKRNFSFLGGFLLAALLALVAISIFNIFWPLSTTGMLAYSFIGVMVFSGYVLFDFSRMKHYGVSAEDVPLMALSLYLDFINLFISILRIFGILQSKD
ncbi:MULTISPECIES: Bax inhibitor-1/YccA family protein [Bacillus]|uniref:Bax inhibitor-1/YccA family protein n=1 Tax=Bacillus salipaludis TaxID=2547811 RepID=A0A4R5VNU5_9BACI|nr:MULTISPECIES: Bax inhibitor-1/YccA family protein [Bacillus]MDQ6596013.1 Bax inhibitor-1/YccA family protein [Bacillus salipaludis]MED1471534.1 Bax inhibitor-1/YccA family protein [Bacillus salipaludis]TDK59939.1 Bax inhibitor-1/YccA family protein [Bacillus salipaludis]